MASFQNFTTAANIPTPPPSFSTVDHCNNEYNTDFSNLLSTIDREILNPSVLSNGNTIVGTCVSNHRQFIQNQCDIHGFIIRDGQKTNVFLGPGDLNNVLKGAKEYSSNLLEKLLLTSPESDQVRLRNDFWGRIERMNAHIVEANLLSQEKWKTQTTSQLWSYAAKELATQFYVLFISLNKPATEKPFYDQQRMTDFVEKVIKKSCIEGSKLFAKFKGISSSTEEEQMSEVLKDQIFKSFMERIRSAGDELLSINKTHEENSRIQVNNLLNSKFLEYRNDLERLFESETSAEGMNAEGMKKIGEGMAEKIWEEIGTFVKIVCMELRHEFLEGFKTEFAKKKEELVQIGVNLLEDRKKEWRNFLENLDRTLDSAKQSPLACRLQGRKLDDRIKILKDTLEKFKQDDEHGVIKYAHGSTKLVAPSPHSTSSCGRSSSGHAEDVAINMNGGSSSTINTGLPMLTWNQDDNTLNDHSNHGGTTAPVYLVAPMPQIDHQSVETTDFGSGTGLGESNVNANAANRSRREKEGFPTTHSSSANFHRRPVPYDLDGHRKLR